MKSTFLVLLMASLAGTLASADLIRMQDGTVYIGKVVAADEKGVTLETFGKTVIVTPRAILSTVPGLPGPDAAPLEVHLKDGSVIRGKISDYDPEIGLLVDINFGTLTIPLDSLETVQDPQQRDDFNGYPVIVGATAGYYGPAGSLAGSFTGGLSISLHAEINTYLVRGLFAGIEANQYFLNYPSSTEVTYSATTATFSPIYRMLFLRSSARPVLSGLVPWVSAGGGVAYVSMQDRRVGAFQPSYGELDPAWCAAIGLDYFVGKRFLIRLCGRWLAIQQSAALLHLPSIQLGTAFNF